MEQRARCRSPASRAGLGNRSLKPAIFLRKQPLFLSADPASRRFRGRQRHGRLTARAVTAPALSTLTFGQSVPLVGPALLALWPASLVADALRKWTRGFSICRRLPGTPESKSLWRSLGGDLKHGLSPQIHREFTALAEQYGGVYHSRVLWAQACIASQASLPSCLSGDWSDLLNVPDDQVVVISDPFVVAQVLSNSSFDKLANCGYESSDLVRQFSLCGCTMQ